jgi:sulfatase maturation enzyme AslB (radical SAM superfamily)
MTKIIKLVEEKQMCSLPWVHTELSMQHDNVKPCCKYRDTLGKISDGVTKVWYNDRIRKLRQDWLDGVSIPECVSCDVADDAFSYKKWKNNAYNGFFTFLDEVDVEDPPLPHIFHISLSNTCNLACRMCNPAQSSILAQMAKKSTELQKYLYIPQHQKKIDPENLRGSFINAKMVTFTGGEPMLDDNIITIMHMLKEETTDLKGINFSTNMMTVNDELLTVLCSIGCEAKLSLSIDGPKNIHEYIRYQLSWDTMMSNIEYITKNYPSITWSLNTTVSNLNVGYITDTIDTVQYIQDRFNIKFHRMMTSPVVDKKFLHPGVLPADIKKQYLDKLENYENKLDILDAHLLVPTAIEMLSNSYDEELPKLVGYLTEFDRIAKTKATDVYPEFKAFMN